VRFAIPTSRTIQEQKFKKYAVAMSDPGFGASLPVEHHLPPRADGTRHPVLLDLQNTGQPRPAVAPAVETRTLPVSGTIGTKVNGLWIDNGGRDRHIIDK
jgi:hypothetical protein